MKLLDFVKTTFHSKFMLYLILLLYAVLLLRNPFSTRTLIPNLEPYPDTFHYLLPARCFLQGQGFTLCRSSVSYEGVAPAVPPVYSLFLLPAFIFTSDLRAFYIINVFLALGSAWLFMQILKKLELSPSLIPALLILFVTTYHHYWVPSLAMAELPLLFLFLCSIFLFQIKTTNCRALVAGFIVGALYGTKYSALALTAIASLFFFCKFIFFTQQSPLKKLQQSILFLSSVSVTFILSGGAVTLFTLLSSFSTESAGEEAFVWYAAEFFPKNIGQYLEAILGREGKYFLWDSRAVLSKPIAVLGLAGIVIGVYTRTQRLFSLYLLGAFISFLGTIPFFYTYDIRYIFPLFSAVLLGVALISEGTLRLLHNRWPVVSQFTWLIGIILCGMVMSARFTPIKNQIALNLKYSEQPWWFLSIQHSNEYLAVQLHEKTPYVISLAPVYLVDEYGSGTYEPLPFDAANNYRQIKNEVWPANDYSNLESLYEQKLSEGHRVFFNSYGMHVEPGFQEYFSQMQQHFIVNKQTEGCYNLCSIYEISLSTTE